MRPELCPIRTCEADPRLPCETQKSPRREENAAVEGAIAHLRCHSPGRRLRCDDVIGADQNVAFIRRAELNLVYRLTRRSGPTPVGTVDSAQAEVLVQPSAQYVPQVGHTHTRCRRLVVQVHDTERSAGRPGPSMVQRCPFGQPVGGISSYPRGVHLHRDQPTSLIELVYERRRFGRQRRMIPIALRSGGREAVERAVRPGR